jgi:hypothetical protein
MSRMALNVCTNARTFAVMHAFRKLTNYLPKLYEKLGVSDRLELALYCLHHQLHKEVPELAPDGDKRFLMHSVTVVATSLKQLCVVVGLVRARSPSEVIDERTYAGGDCPPLGAKSHCTVGLELKIYFTVAAPAQPVVFNRFGRCR